ncbi:MAG: hypothetical protein KF866_03695 [Phycisphaeraceae bacterium]|nr:hypothetical protein [Phycisphaeraceae bacterium]MCW5753203.1 hypothetical protein [Phycisphaeraceae bacterium]
MRAHLVQFDIVWENRERNFRRVESMLAEASVAEGDLVLLPELFDSGFSLRTAETADHRQETAAFLARLASNYGATVQGGRTLLPDREAKACNAATIYGPSGDLLAEYHKMHPFSFGREPEAFAPGHEIITYTWRSEAASLSVCPAICYDLRFPELFRIAALRGAEVFALGANWPNARQHHWRTLLIARAIENQAVALGVNRVGADPTLEYVGGSIAVGPQGEILGELGAEEAVLSVTIDPDAIRSWRSKFPALTDIRLLNREKPLAD